MDLGDLPCLKKVQSMLGGGSIKQRSGAKAYRYRLHNKPGMINLVNCINGHIRHSGRLNQLHRVCGVQGIAPIMPKESLSITSSYFAGFFDADGTINLTYKYGYPLITISVSQKHLQDLIIFQQVFGSSIFYASAQNGHYKWSIQSRAGYLALLDYFNSVTFRSHKSGRFFLINLRLFTDGSQFTKDYLSLRDLGGIQTRQLA